MPKKKCKHCKEYFKEVVTFPAGTFCTFDHALDFVDEENKKKKAKKEKALKQDHLKLKRENRDNDLSYRKKKAQEKFNQFIRIRDRGLPCVSCDKPDDGAHQRHASHYRSVGACSILRFNELNCHASCSQCNNMKSGNLIEYRIRLVKKIGAKLVDWLECQNDVTRWKCEELKAIEKHYKDKINELQ